MLQTLSCHNPSAFIDWITRNIQVGNEPWFVQWSYALLLQTEEVIPLVKQESEKDGQWDPQSTQMREFDRVFTQVMLMWRTVLDYTEDDALVDQLVNYLQHLMMKEEEDEEEEGITTATSGRKQWKTLVLKKLQTHFVDIADVLIGWMMTTGPRSILRETILSLLHEFGQLWADNSVFSLQLLHSFADEITNLCDSWKDHQESDNDRLSTLLMCFMMVAQCVPDLAFAAAESTDSPFVRVLHRVVSCPQPEYSLFCLANCSEYLVAISSCKHSSFPPLSVAAVRFLLYHCAVQSQMHDSEIDKLSKVMENTCKLASANFCMIKDPLSVQTTAIDTLEDDVPCKFFKRCSQSKREKTIECLYQLKLASGVTHVTQLCLELVRLGGIGALKALGVQALQRLSDLHSEKETSCFVFEATCFILASRNPERLTYRGGHHEAHVIAFLELVLVKLEKQNHRSCQHRLTPRQLCLVLKMMCAFIGALSHCNFGRSNATELVNKVSLRMLECASSLLASGNAKGLDYRSTLDLLKVIGTILSESKLVSVVPHKVCLQLVKAITVVVHCSSVRVREECLQVLSALTFCAEAHSFACNVLEVSLDLALDHRIRDKVVSSVMSDVARWALLTQDKVSAPRNRLQDLHASFAGADFENIMSLFQAYECNTAEWNRVCGRIVDRIAQGVVFRNADVLLNAVRQAAGWCVHYRLRTHFGGPAQSFKSIERLLQEYSIRMQHVSGQTSQKSVGQLLCNWLLLEFVIALEMRIIRAVCSTGGDHSSLESEDNKSALFFRTNKAVCDDWFIRIRPLLVEMSKHGPSYELWRYHSHARMTTCYSRLSRAMTSLTSHGGSEQVYNELKEAEKELDVALFSLCRCHVDAKDADSIVGFRRWGDSVTSSLSNWYQSSKEVLDTEKEQLEVPLFQWLSAMHFEAKMRYEDAAAEYESLLQPLLSDVESCFSRDVSVLKIVESPMQYLRMSHHALLGCFEQCAKCYASLREWTKLRSLVSHFVNMAQSLMDSGHSIERARAILAISDTWSNEIENIRSLEPEVVVLAEDAASKGELKIDSMNRAALALRVWSIFSSPVAGSPLLQSDNVVSQLSSELIPLALQPSPWNGYAGETISKRAEEILLRMFGCSQKARSFETQQAELPMDGLRLNHEVYDCAVWSQPFGTPSLNCWSDHRSAESGDADCLHLVSVARLTRKQHNFTFARHLLKEAAAIKGASQKSLMAVNYEKAKLLEIIGMEDESRCLLEAQCEIDLSSTELLSGLENATTRAFLHLATTLAKVDSTKQLSPVTCRIVQNTLMGITNLDKRELLKDQNDLDFLPQLEDAAVYKCLVAATAVSPKSAKAWIRYSHWCYDQGKQEIARITEKNGYIHLDSSDEARVNDLLDEIGIAELERDLIVRAFCHFLENGELVGPRVDYIHQICTSRVPDHNSDALNRLIQLQRLCHSKVLRFHRLSAHGYGKYLTVLLSDPNANFPKQEITMVALRVLGLLTTYGAESDMVSALEGVFSNGSVTPWSYIVPQLIARVHHPVAAVSSLVCLILKRLAHHSPHSIVYPTVMYCMEDCEKERSAANTFTAVLHELENVSSGQVEGVRLLISELRRISILWDEAWISALMKLTADVARRTCTLEKEATRVDRNVSLSANEKAELAQRKMVAIMKPILVSIDRLWNETCGRARDQPNVSPHERKFLKEYGGLIEKAIESFRDCCSSELRVESIKTPQELWQPFADIMKALMNATSRRDQLLLHDISPAMALASRELVLTNMPGALSGQSDPTTIYRVNPFVTVMRTKTKPKSLGFIGSDGKTHKYLLKAREDLRLDERIMQFLRVTNNFLRADTAAAARDLSAQNYSVIPLSQNAGLIQMVPDVVPLFQVYVSRNEDETTNEQVSHNSAAASSAQQPPPPTALFYARLKHHGVTNVSPNNRAQWPISVLKQVYLELVAQRPRNVLLQEILLRSEDLRESWTKSVRLSKSLAVMSVLGYIVGLGDRHLDNMLLCVNSGNILHIDHNVCFEKGRTLKVPEVVPFRLTPMLQDALGFTGVEGKFRVAFETTLRVVRSHDVREALLTLFEAFVYSPLVDWISADKRQGRSGDLKARLEVNVNLSLFLSRAEERRQDTITFGRQYEQFADVITRILEETKVPIIDLLEQRKRVQSIEKEEQALLREVSKSETEMCTYRSGQNFAYASMEAATAQAKEMSAKLAAFANECFAKHQQIEVWRQKSISFAETDPVVQLNAVTKGVDSASFQDAHARLSDILAKSWYDGPQEEVFAALESKCISLDINVRRLRVEIEMVAMHLIPCLSTYSRCRKELDAYLDSALQASAKDVYIYWWNRCTECLRGLVAGANAEPVSTEMSRPIALSQKSLDYSDVMIKRLDEDDLRYPKYIGEMKQDASIILEATQLLQEVWNALSAIKLSNAQGQRLLKLAGASWIVDIMKKLGFYSNVNAAVTGAFTPVLATPVEFQQIVTVSYACSTLLELVSTPKGSMKRLRASDLLAEICENDLAESNQRAKANLQLFIDALQAVGSFAIVLQEEFISNLHGRQWDKNVCQDLLKSVREMSGGIQSVTDTILMPSAINDGQLSAHIAIQNVLTAALKVIRKFSAVAGSLQQGSVLTDKKAERMNILSSSSWIELVLNFITLLSADQPKQRFEDEARTLWSDHMDAFVSSCVVKLLRYLLSSVISFEWKFDFFVVAEGMDINAINEVQTLLNSRWLAFFRSQIADILPSASSNDTSEAHVNAVNKSVARLMAVCEEWWSQKWRIYQSALWQKKISSLRTRHERRLRYGTWLATTPTDSVNLGESPCLSRAKLLSFLSSQIPHLNALLTDQIAVEADALELAQQMDCLASNLSSASPNDRQSANEKFHECVQKSYTNAVALFDYGRALADLVQGISVIETSSGDFVQGAGQMELEVNVVGKSLLHKAFEATIKLQACSNAVIEVEARARALEDEIERKRALYNTIALSKCATKARFDEICSQNKDTVVDVSRMLWKHVKELRLLLRSFDKFKKPLKQTTPAESEGDPLQTQLQAEKNKLLSVGPLSPRFTVGYFFMENDRLVKILLRSIRSVKHLQLLEGVLERHEEACTEIRETIDQIDQALADFDTLASQLLVDESQDKAGVDSDADAKLTLLLNLIEALRVINAKESQLLSESSARIDTTDETSIPLLVVGRDLVRKCVKLFFEATEMADRMSSAEDESHKTDDDVSTQYVNDEDEEQHENTDNFGAPIAIESGNSVVLGVCSGNSSHATTTSSPCNVEEKSRYGLQVLKRIEEKLSGTVTEMAHAPFALTVEQQASWLIDEATKTDNLCVMYEGWTPWI
ncbi:unnamed protein product [Peronospora belbahrii]|uniref:non-specific serine/threonine protein kinase n=1 Tax=Peronospora belbahrii TaxID=622444 RepID=A0ABN8D3U4_9STRA|nr:unnamed protein product [Peronospora belbahrii]